MDGKLLLIEWEDSQGCSPSWESIESYAPEDVIIKSIGWVVAESKTTLSIAAHVAEKTTHTYRQANGIMTIPKRCIVNKWVIEGV